MIEKTLLPRRWWKTTAAIHRSNSSWAPIVCMDQKRVHIILNIARGMNIKIPDPVVAPIDNWYNIDAVIVDDAEEVLQKLLWKEIILLTMSTWKTK